MIIDSHYHLEPRLESVDRLLTQMKKFRIDRTALIPTLADPFHIGRIGQALSGIMRNALTGPLQSLGLVMYRSTVTSGGNFSILGATYPIYSTVDNAATARVMADHPDKFYGWILVNPAAGVSAPEVEKYAGTRGWIGVKAHPFWHRYAVRDLDSTAAVCAHKGLPLLLHLGGTGDRGDYRILPEQHPGLTLIYAHAGVPFYQSLWEYARNKPNVFIDLSSPYLNEPLRRAALAAMGPGKCLFGSDGPYGYPDPVDGGYDHGAILEEMLRLPLSSSDRDRVLSGNFLAMIPRA